MPSTRGCRAIHRRSLRADPSQPVVSVWPTHTWERIRTIASPTPTYPISRPPSSSTEPARPRGVHRARTNPATASSPPLPVAAQIAGSRGNASPPRPHWR